MALSSSELQDQNRSEVPTQTVTNTPWGNLIGKCCGTRQNLTLPPFTTLNERYNILAATSIGIKNGHDFELKYFGIGVRGSNCTGQDANGVSKIKVNQHQPIDMNLFHAIPFIARPLSAPLDNLTRSKYRMRVVENDINGIPTEFYYLRLIDFTEYNPEVNDITRDANNNEIATKNIPVKDSLFNPQPQEFTSEGTVPVSNVYVNSSALLGCSSNANDLQEIADACRRKYGDASYGSINETMLCWGIDTQTDGQISGGATIRYTEVMSAVAAHFVTERDGRNVLNNTAIEMNYDHGASEPMLLHTLSSN